MQTVYNSDHFVIVQFDVPADVAESGEGGLRRGGFEIVDKLARKEIFIEGAMAASFKEGVEALFQGSPSQEDFDEYLSRFAALMQQPVVLH